MLPNQTLINTRQDLSSELGVVSSEQTVRVNILFPPPPPPSYQPRPEICNKLNMSHLVRGGKGGGGGAGLWTSLIIKLYRDWVLSPVSPVSRTMGALYVVIILILKLDLSERRSLSRLNVRHELGLRK